MSRGRDRTKACGPGLFHLLRPPSLEKRFPGAKRKGDFDCGTWKRGRGGQGSEATRPKREVQGGLGGSCRAGTGLREARRPGLTSPGVATAALGWGAWAPQELGAPAAQKHPPSCRQVGRCPGTFSARALALSSLCPPFSPAVSPASPLSLSEVHLSLCLRLLSCSLPLSPPVSDFLSVSVSHSLFPSHRRPRWLPWAVLSPAPSLAVWHTSGNNYPGRSGILQCPRKTYRHHMGTRWRQIPQETNHFGCHQGPQGRSRQPKSKDPQPRGCQTPPASLLGCSAHRTGRTGWHPGQRPQEQPKAAGQHEKWFISLYAY